MNSDSYKIIISLSHGRISFEYWLRDAEDKLTPMPTGHWPAPLAFYCTSTGIKTGEDAARAAHAGMSGAYDDYFSLIKTAETYTLGSQRLMPPSRCSRISSVRCSVAVWDRCATTAPLCR